MPTLTARIEYIVSRAEWKILGLTWDNGQAAPLPKQRYFLTHQDIAQCLQGLYLPDSITLKRRDICEDEQHSLQGAEYMAMSRNVASVYVRCHCQRFRQVSMGEWEALQRQRRAAS
jgi:hypothetical protein